MHVDECHSWVFNTFLVRIPVEYRYNPRAFGVRRQYESARARATLASFASKLHCPIFRADFAVTSRRIIAIDVYICSVDSRDGAIKMIPVFSELRRLIINARAARRRERDAHVAAAFCRSLINRSRRPAKSV